MDDELDKFGKNEGNAYNADLDDLEAQINALDSDDDMGFGKPKINKVINPNSNAIGSGYDPDDIAELERMMGDSEGEEKIDEEVKLEDPTKLDSSSTRSNPVVRDTPKVNIPKQSASEMTPKQKLENVLKYETMVMNVGLENSLIVIDREIIFCEKQLKQDKIPEPILKHFKGTCDALKVKKKKLLILIGEGKVTARIYSQSIIEAFKSYCKVLGALKAEGATEYMSRLMGKIDQYKKENEQLVSNLQETFAKIVAAVDSSVNIPTAIEKTRGSRSNNEPKERPKRRINVIPDPKPIQEKYDISGYIYVPNYESCSIEMLIEIFQIRYQQYKNYGKYLMNNLKQEKQEYLEGTLIPILTECKKLSLEIESKNVNNLRNCLSKTATGLLPDVLYGEVEGDHFARLYKLQKIFALTANQISEQIADLSEKGIKNTVVFKLKNKVKEIEEDFNYLVSLNKESWTPMPKIESDKEVVHLSTTNEEIPGNKIFIHLKTMNINPSKNKIHFKGNLTYKDKKYEFDTDLVIGQNINQKISITLKEPSDKPLRGIDRVVINFEIYKKKSMAFLFGEKVMSRGKLKLTQLSTMNSIEEVVKFESEKNKKLELAVEVHIRESLTPNTIDFQYPKITKKYSAFSLNEGIEDNLELFRHTYSGKGNQQQEIPQKTFQPGESNSGPKHEDDMYVKPKSQISKLSHATELEENQKISTLPDSIFNDVITRERLNYPEKDEVYSILFSALCNQMTEDTRTSLREENNFTAYREAEPLAMHTKKLFYKIQAASSNDSLENDDIIENLKSNISSAKKFLDICIEQRLPARAKFFAEKLNILTSELDNADIKYIQENIVENYGVTKDDEIVVKNFLQFTRNLSYPQFKNPPLGKSLAQIQKLEDPEYYFSTAFCLIVKMSVNQYLAIEGKKPCRINLLKLQEKINKYNDAFMEKMTNGDIEPEDMIKSSNKLLSDDKQLLQYFTSQNSKEYVEFVKLRIKLTEFDLEILKQQIEG